MSATPSTMSALGSVAPHFVLPNTNPDIGDTIVALADFTTAPALLVAFICNHCPYVIHMRDAFVALAREYQASGLAVVAISANDATGYPADGAEQMAADCREFGYSFPYLYDATQAVAKAYWAACTPDFFLYDEGRTLVYRGQFDASRPGNNVPVTGRDLRAAIDAVLAGHVPAAAQVASIGCNIKWRVGNAPHYGQ